MTQRKGQKLWNEIWKRYHSEYDSVSANALVGTTLWHMTDEEFDEILKPQLLKSTDNSTISSSSDKPQLNTHKGARVVIHDVTPETKTILIGSEWKTEEEIQYYKDWLKERDIYNYKAGLEKAIALLHYCENTSCTPDKTEIRKWIIENEDNETILGTDNLDCGCDAKSIADEGGYFCLFHGMLFKLRTELEKLK